MKDALHQKLYYKHYRFSLIWQENFFAIVMMALIYQGNFSMCQDISLTLKGEIDVAPLPGCAHYRAIRGETEEVLYAGSSRYR